MLFLNSECVTPPDQIRLHRKLSGGPMRPSAYASGHACVCGPVEQFAKGQVEIAIAKAEQAGLKLAIKGRLFAIVPIALWYATMAYYPASLIGLGALAGFAGLGLLHHRLIDTGREKRWHRFVFIAVDAATLAVIAVWLR